MKHIILVGSLLFLISCSEKQKASELGWHGSMQGLATTLTNLMPNLVTTKWGDEKSQHDELEKALKQLKDYSDNLDPSRLAVPTNDPSIEFLAQDFKAEIQQVQNISKTKPIAEMKPSVRNLARYCVACHTRTQAGSSVFTADMDRKMQGFDHFEKATYLTSFRQYEKAMVNYEEALNNKEWAKGNSEKWNEGAMNLLAISVRVKNNANLTLELLSKLFDTNSIPKNLYDAARVWQQDAKAWNKEKPNVTLTKIKSLLDQAEARERKLRYSGLLLNVRASAMLNEYLRAGGMKAYREQGFLYFSGIIGERLQKLNFSEFPKSYYKACVAVDPKGHYTKLCQQRLEAYNVARL